MRVVCAGSAGALAGRGLRGGVVVTWMGEWELPQRKEDQYGGTGWHSKGGVDVPDLR